MTTKNDLLTMIDELVTKNTLSLEGVKVIEELRKKADLQARMIEQLQADNSRCHAEKLQAQNLVSARSNELDAARTIIKAMTEREGTVVNLEKAKAVAEAESKVWDKAFDRVFRVPTVRETITSSVPIEVTAYSYMNGHQQPSGSIVQNHVKTATIIREET
jgi:hypothetical protein